MVFLYDTSHQSKNNESVSAEHAFMCAETLSFEAAISGKPYGAQGQGNASCQRCSAISQLCNTRLVQSTYRLFVQKYALIVAQYNFFLTLPLRNHLSPSAMRYFTPLACSLHMQSRASLFPHGRLALGMKYSFSASPARLPPAQAVSACYTGRLQKLSVHEAGRPITIHARFC